MEEDTMSELDYIVQRMLSFLDDEDEPLTPSVSHLLSNMRQSYERAPFVAGLEENRLPSLAQQEAGTQFHQTDGNLQQPSAANISSSNSSVNGSAGNNNISQASPTHNSTYWDDCLAAHREHQQLRQQLIQKSLQEQMFREQQMHDWMHHQLFQQLQQKHIQEWMQQQQISQQLPVVTGASLLMHHQLPQQYQPMSQPVYPQMPPQFPPPLPYQTFQQQPMPNFHPMGQFPPPIPQQQVYQTELNTAMFQRAYHMNAGPFDPCYDYEPLGPLPQFPPAGVVHHHPNVPNENQQKRQRRRRNNFR